MAKIISIKDRPRPSKRDARDELKADVRRARENGLSWFDIRLTLSVLEANDTTWKRDCQQEWR